MTKYPGYWELGSARSSSGLVLAIVAGVVIFIVNGSKIEASGNVGPVVSLFVAALFALAPLLACFAQTISIDRRSKKLDGVIIPKIKATQYFQIAKAALASVQPASVSQQILWFQCCCLR
jgi:Na+/serine symporter